MKVIELSGAQLDWAVAQCEYFPVRHGFDDNCPEYSTNWVQGGPIIEREQIGLWCDGGDGWAAEDYIHAPVYGSTPLIAAMRCYVVSRLGQEVELPEGLL